MSRAIVLIVALLAITPACTKKEAVAPVKTAADVSKETMTAEKVQFEAAKGRILDELKRLETEGQYCSDPSPASIGSCSVLRESAVYESSSEGPNSYNSWIGRKARLGLTDEAELRADAKAIESLRETLRGEALLLKNNLDVAMKASADLQEANIQAIINTQKQRRDLEEKPRQEEHM